MKPYLEYLIRPVSDPLQQRNLVREYLQARTLETLQHHGAMRCIAFQGGTALRFLFSLPRFSEDLDFALEQNREDYDFLKYLEKIKQTFAAENYRVEVSYNNRKTVHSAFIRFYGLLYELGLSPHAGEALSIKLEIDSNPPDRAGLETSIVRRHVVLQVLHYDKASLLAGKIHALLDRDYTKGRDLYDLLWYLSDPAWPPPNLVFLNNALVQTGWQKAPLGENDWKSEVWKKLERMDFAQVVNDVKPFIEDRRELALLELSTFKKLLAV